jgi:hypothetical protein
MLKLVALTDAGDKPIYVNPALVTFVEHPAIGMFGATAIHFVGDHQITVKERTETVLAILTGEGAASAPKTSRPASDQAIPMPAPAEV